MNDSDGIHSTIAVVVLRAHKVDTSVQPSDENQQELTTMIKGNIVEVQQFPRVLSRRMVNRLARLFDVPVHHFYHPELAPQSTVH